VDYVNILEIMCILYKPLNLIRFWNVQAKLSCLMINDLDAGVEQFGGSFSKFIYLFDTLSILVKGIFVCMHIFQELDCFVCPFYHFHAASPSQFARIKTSFLYILRSFFFG
jgi:hypothetical protein